MITLVPFTGTHHSNAIRLWNAATHADYPINGRLMAYNTAACTGETIEGRLAIQEGEAVGFILACALQGGSLGWISAIAVVITIGHIMGVG